MTKNSLYAFVHTQSPAPRSGLKPYPTQIKQLDAFLVMKRAYLTNHDSPIVHIVASSKSLRVVCEKPVIEAEYVPLKRMPPTSRLCRKCSLNIDKERDRNGEPLPLKHVPAARPRSVWGVPETEGKRR